ncbi:RelA/SpoT domain-containing protein [Vibrio fluvialis]|uniref:RelA/SpoT domain-containing protein n=1 Tax=Vibrio fluvialis TaxID=676 RepID=UPI001EEA3782|nr:RelA/SpoT domain-containing protein [Vibrio fluvialis]EKO3500719.1 RelA/SpoT domain-containing protein [Vibrio fluvialis]EKO3519528.1 RelA/SpoT domain-containing protein [Vibrio fluvialis]MCG6398872.1 RelA/SpoT domain-containing protein [Vibrio fluvialis]
MSQYENQKRPLRYSKKQIDRAADKIRHGVEGEERLEAIELIQSYREFHLYPLMLLKNHLVRTAKKISPDVIVARRLKRLPTIIDKLERPSLDGKSTNTIKFTRMQDIAGCRAIVKNPKQLWALKKRLERSRSVHTIIRTKDYLSEPKDSGYGGLHLIYKCYEGQDQAHDWKGSLVEIQLRTALQHAWATSLEIIDTLENINLKTSVENHAEWRMFFQMAGKLVAHKEGFSVLGKELYQYSLLHCGTLSSSLNVWSKLSKYELAITISTDSDIVPTHKLNSNGLFLIRVTHEAIEKKTYQVGVKFFSNEESAIALELLNESELDDKYALAVLVSAEGVRSLKQAYPNYFGATDLFREFLTYVHDESGKAAEEVLASSAKLISECCEQSDTGTQLSGKTEKVYQSLMELVKNNADFKAEIERRTGIKLDV